MSGTYTRDNLPTEGWANWRKTQLTQMKPLAGPCEIVTQEGSVTVPDGWQGFLAIDSGGYPYPVAGDVHAATYEPA